METGSIQAWLSSIRNFPWQGTWDVAQLALYYLGVFAVFGCLLRLGTIRAIIRDFREARGPLWDLRSTVTDLKELEPVVRNLGDQLALIGEKVDASRKQVADLQVESLSARTDADELGEETVVGVQAPTPAIADDGEDRNWQVLREHWKKNRLRLDYVIDHIRNGRTKVAFDRIPWRKLRQIVDKLERQHIISTAAANASRSLHDLFYKYRPRNQKVPDEVVGALEILDKQLDRTSPIFQSSRCG